MSELSTAYARDGFFLPHRAISTDAALALRRDYEDAERSVAGDKKKQKLLRQYPHRVLPTFDELVRSPTLVEPVRELIGDELLVWGCGLFIKEPATQSIVSWHQDLTYWGLDDAREVTAWVALSPSTAESGAMRFIPGSHRKSIVEHVDTFDENNLLSRGQEIAVDVDESDAVTVLLEPGEASLHHGKLFHASGPNRSDDRRMGVAIRYIDASMKQREGQIPQARRVSGSRDYGNFTLVEGPSGRLLEADFAECDADLTLRESFLYE